MATNNVPQKPTVLCASADLLRGHYKQADYGKVVLPFTVLRRLDFVLEPTKPAVLAAYAKHKDKKPEVLEPILNNAAKAKFHNRSKFDFAELTKDHNNIAANLRHYINGFSIGAKEIIDYFSFDDQIKKLDEYDLLYLVIKKFAEAGDLFKGVDTIEMGYIFEELIRKFAELSNETAGEHFTPREVIRLMVNILFVNDKDILRRQGIVKTMYDPACGTGGMLSVAEEYLHDLNPDARLEVFGQEINPESYAICKSDMLIKGQNPANIKFGNTFTQDGLDGETFDCMLSNPPFGVDWKKAEKAIKDEAAKRGFAGRFGAGLPSISDGSFQFLQHMISKMKRTAGGSRIGIVFNGSPLFSGGAGSGPSDIRKWIIENDMLDMEPLTVLVEMSRNREVYEVDGALQIGKVYRSGTSEFFGIMWPSVKGVPTFLGKTYGSHNKPRVKYFDPDTCEMVEDEIPKCLINIESFNDFGDYEFLKSCYSQEDNYLKSDLSEKERERLISVFREYAYREFLKVAENNPQLDVQEGSHRP
jgi:type I restriction enzyme M protein